MSKARFTEFIDGLTDEQLRNLTGVGATLREFGKHLETEWQQRFGVLMDTDGRKENDGKPNETADPVIDIEVPGVMCLMLRPCEDNNKTRGHGYANDVGLADKVKFGNVPPTLLTEILLDKQVAMLDGNISAAALNDLKEALQQCMVIEDGKFTFNKKAAPPLNHPVEVAEWLASLKTEFIGTTAGATHVSMEVVPIPIESTSTNDAALTDTAATDLLGSLSIPSSTEADEAQHNNEDTVEPSPSVVGEGTPFIDQQGQVLF